MFQKSAPVTYSLLFGQTNALNKIKSTFQGQNQRLLKITFSFTVLDQKEKPARIRDSNDI